MKLSVVARFWTTGPSTYVLSFQTATGNTGPKYLLDLELFQDILGISELDSLWVHDSVFALPRNTKDVSLCDVQLQQGVGFSSFTVLWE